EELQSNGAASIGVPVDVSDRAAVDDAMRQVRSELGPIEIIVTSAGFDRFEPFTDISLEGWERMIAVNLTGTFHCLQAAVPDMLAACVFLCSDDAGYITGQQINVNGGWYL